MLLAEANQWPEDAVTYFGGGKGDECHMAFHFPLMPRMFMAVRMEDRVPVVDILDQTPAIPETSQWALFLRNHDELTLEMVTDEERDYMYRVYANDTRARINLGIRRRLAPLLGNDRKRIELLHMLLFSLPGTPVLYYGDEIGMGDNVYLGDRNGVRTPMQWSSDRNAGFSRATPQALYLPIVLDPEYHYEAVNVDVQQRNPHSLYWWVKRAITLRKRFKAFGRGTLKFLSVDNRKVLAFVRCWGDQVILVVANLSRFTQPAEMDLSEYQGRVPVELFGQTAFPSITAQPWFLTLSPHSAHWFMLETAAARQAALRLVPGAEITAAGEAWADLLEGSSRSNLESALLHYISGRRWFSETAPKAVRLKEAIPVGIGLAGSQLLVLSVDAMHGEPKEMLVPIAIASAEEAELLERDSPQLVIARLKTGAGLAGGALLYEAVADRRFCTELLKLFARRKAAKLPEAELNGVARSELRALAEEPGAGLEPLVRRADQHHSTIVYGSQLFLKLYRVVEPGANPELQLERFLNRKKFPYVPQVLGWLDLHRPNGDVITLAAMRRFMPDARDARVYFIETITRYFERVPATREDAFSWPMGGTLFEMASAAVPEPALRLIGLPVELVRILGQRTAEMHLVLASETDNRDFAPEPFTPFYQRSLFQSLRNLVVNAGRLLRRNFQQIPEELRPLALQVLDAESSAVKSLQTVHTTAMSAYRIRCHGVYHLGQLLFTGKDFIIANFDGRSSRSFGERRIKHSGFYDVASMLRSFSHAAHAALEQQVATGAIHSGDMPRFTPWSVFWFRWTAAAFLKAYLESMGKTELLPAPTEQRSALLKANLLGGCYHDLENALINHPERLSLALRSIIHLIAPGPDLPPLFDRIK
jgi:maltose alpha-D-glucosyltransferase/alpha-amylase